MMTQNQTYSSPPKQPRPVPQIPTTQQIPTQQHVLPFEVPGLEGKTMLELEELLSDDHIFASFFYSIDRVATIRSAQSALIHKNAELAKSNLSRSQEIQSLKSRIESLQTQHALQRQQIDKLLRTQQSHLEPFGLAHITEQLRGVVASADDMSETCAAAFLEGKLGEEEFIKAFKESRRVYHLRMEKLEKLEEMQS